MYRLTILIEFPPYKRGDVMTDGKRLLVVKAFSKKIQFQNVITGKKVEEPYGKTDFELLETFTAKVSQVHPEPAIVNPVTYQQVPVKSREEVVVEQQVIVVKFHNSWYVV